jgi:hypothetical protein
MAVTADLRTMVMIFISPKFRIPVSCNIVTRPKANEHYHTSTQCSNYYNSKQFILVVVEKLQKANISFVMSACKTIRIEKLDSHETEFREFSYFNIFLKYVTETQISLKSDMNNLYFTWRPMYVYDNISLNLRRVHYIETWTLIKFKKGKLLSRRWEK